MNRTESWLKSSCTLCCTALILMIAGCNDAQVKQSAGPIEGKRLDGVNTADATPTPKNEEKKNDDPQTSVTPAEKVTPDTKADGDSTAAAQLTPEQEKKKREEWRNKKTGKPDENDPIAQANITLRPSLADPDGKAKTKDAKTTEDGKSKATTNPPSDPTALAKPLLDPTVEAPFADPNNPDFIPADRLRAKTFTIDKLKSSNDHLIVPFMDLSGFAYSGMTGAPAPTEDGKEPAKPQYVIPESIQALNGKKVAISGYMMPIDFENGGTNEFVLTRQIPSCFYCVPPQLNDWIEVKMKDGKRVNYVPDGIVELYGTIEVGEIKEDGFVVAMYRMTGTKMIESKQE